MINSVEVIDLGEFVDKITFCDGIEYYGLDKNSKGIMMLNKVNMTFHSLKVKSLNQLKHKLVVNYGKEHSILIANAHILSKNNQLRDNENYKELFNCLDNYLMNYFENTITKVIELCLDSIKRKVDKVYLSCCRVDGEISLVLYSVHYNNISEHMLDMKTYNSVSQAVKGLYDNLDREKNDTIGIVVDYSLSDKLVNCNLENDCSMSNAEEFHTMVYNQICRR